MDTCKDSEHSGFRSHAFKIDCVLREGKFAMCSGFASKQSKYEEIQLARYGCAITGLKNPVVALYRTNLQISVGPVLHSVLAWQKCLQLSTDKKVGK